MMRRFGDLAIDPNFVVAVSKRLVKAATPTGGVVDHDESCMIVTNEKRTATNVIPISAAGADALLTFVEEKQKGDEQPKGDA